MLIAAAGDCHGQLDRLYQIIEEMEGDLGRQVDVVLQVGDFGIWPNPDHVDKATRKREGAGDFPRWWQTRRAAPRPTWFIAGNHEDFGFLTGLHNTQLLPGLHFIPWGRVAEIKIGKETLRVGGVGGCYSPRSYQQAALSGSKRKNYTRHEVRQLRDSHNVDIVLFHDAPEGTLQSLHHQGGARTAPAQGLLECVAHLQPGICLSGHWHFRTERLLHNVRTVGLNIVPQPGSVIFLEKLPHTRHFEQLAEWGGPPSMVTHIQNTAVHTPTLLDPAHLLPELTTLLERWAKEVRGDGPPNRKTRKRLHQALGNHPHRPILMSALTCGDTQAALGKHTDPTQRDDLLTLWTQRIDPRACLQNETETGEPDGIEAEEVSAGGSLTR